MSQHHDIASLTREALTPSVGPRTAEEQCDGCHTTIDDEATKLKLRTPAGLITLLYCRDCASPVERCDTCGFLICDCEY